MQNFARLGLAVSCLAILSACSDLVTGGDLIRPGEPTGTIRVVNGTSGNLDVVLISECNVGSYGLNRMPEGSYIPPGGSYDFTVSAGCWDVDVGAVGMGEARHRMQVAAYGGVEYTVNQ